MEYIATIEDLANFEHLVEVKLMLPILQKYGIVEVCVLFEKLCIIEIIVYCCILSKETVQNYGKFGVE